MTERKFIANLFELSQGIDLCLENMLSRPALVLLYTAIDVVAWLACDDPKVIPKARFIAWVGDYLLPAGSLNCSAVDLYGARCAVLHTLTPDSNLSDRGEAKVIGYSWGAADLPVYEQVIETADRSDSDVGVSIDALHAAWRHGVSNFWDDLRADPARQAQVYGRADKFFAEIRLPNQ